ncbi:Uncharacterised protein [Sphingobacterium spiritivorum]|uniref:DUF6265 domain-containing protein n=1 Tax=Sphingobacterium spiritivorum TaxID=258 RepID=A0A380CCQ6_SPHSI|nr:DUF6265 family protein [Sphingobacterium spiritivorum]SUJ17985.1 Uncharacterised protein [Sphingobacterium spiritivorum]
MKTPLKLIVMTLSAFVFTMCSNKQNGNSKADNFDWLLGNWQRTNEEKGKMTFEIWQKVDDSAYKGVGFTMQNKDTVSQEQMKIVKTYGKWNLLVKTREEKDFIKFDVSDMENGSFTFKNDSLNFPKTIKYWKNGDKLNATVTGDEIEIAYEFKQLK